MGKLKTQEEFIKDSIEVHGDKYTYELLEYVNGKSKVDITCTKHGPFNIAGTKLLGGQGCQICASEKQSLNSRDTIEKFVEKAQALHGDKYDYSLVELVNDNTLVKIRCKKHDTVFNKTPSKHKSGQGCPVCARESQRDKRLHTLDEFLSLARKAHGDKYDYSKVVLGTDSDIVEIICTKHNTSFWQMPASHKQGSGCPTCAIDIRSLSRKVTSAQFADNARVKHGDKYDYSRSVVDGVKTKVEIICPQHDSFWMSPSKHTGGRGCPKCSWEGSGYSQTKPGTFYILQHEGITKVGITNRKVIERIKGINRDSGLDFKLHSAVFSEDGAKARNIELQVLAWLKLHYKNVETKFDGYTECFVAVDIDALMSFVVPIS